MKAVILAAGLGSRLGEFTRYKPKTLLTVGGKPLIAHILTSLSAAGVREAIIITGHGEEVLRGCVGDGSAFGLRVSYIRNPVYDTTNNIYSLSLVEGEVDEGFIIVNSDVYFHPGVLESLMELRHAGVALLVDLRRELGEEEMKVVLRGREVLDISKQIPPEEAHGEYTGIALVSGSMVAEFFSALRKVMEEQGMGVYYEEAFKKLIERGHRVEFAPTRGLPWIEIDTPADLEAAEACWRSTGNCGSVLKPGAAAGVEFPCRNSLRNSRPS
ncbi:MAG: phosphocholine cytidylyltransferase family protein [Euryarchaeota archaeon]|nr:phosphocholine cytidylyltransferase family protein [Euryarchaeota archaeon]